MSGDRAAAGRLMLQPVAASVTVARHWIIDCLAGWSREVVDRAALLVTELVTNAVVHARSPVEVSVRRTDRALRIEVVDQSVSPPVVKVVDPTSTSGRGLRLVETLATAWGVRPLASGKAVWFELAAPDNGAAGGRGDASAG